LDEVTARLVGAVALLLEARAGRLTFLCKKVARPTNAGF
jgi:hypothetical protein